MDIIELRHKVERHHEALHGDNDRLGLIARVTNLEASRRLAIALVAFLGSNILITLCNLVVHFLTK